jgi:hypothetical protein
VRAALVLLLVVLWIGPGVGCSSVRSLWPFSEKAAAPLGDPSHGIEMVSNEAVVDFYERAVFFYSRLARRRFNTLATYRDELLRDFFRSEIAFSDYYADLAEAMENSHFEQNRPLSLDVVEFVVEGPGSARVNTRIVGENGLPLRFWETRLDRVDRWERVEGTWWIVPGKL